VCLVTMRGEEDYARRQAAYGGSMAPEGTPMGGQYMTGPNPNMPLLTGRPQKPERGSGICGVGDCVDFDVDDEYGEDAQLSYVGNGRGKYVQETTYKYVGKGAGTFDVVGAPSIGSAPLPVTNRCCWLGLCGLLSLLLLGSLLWWILAATGWLKGGGSGEYDCQAGVSNWRLGWSDQKKAWCCNTKQIGCISPTTSLPYDCSAGFDNWSHGWSIGKKVWCCMNARRGCPTAPPTSLPFDCNIAFNNWVAAWSEPKKQWCCVHARRGCPTTTPVRPTIQIPVPVPAPAPPVFQVPPAPVTSLPFDCNAGFVNWVAGWSWAKKAWCCAHANRGCQNQIGA